MSVDSSPNWLFSNWRVNNLANDKWPSINLVEDQERAAVIHDGTHHLHSHKGDGSRISGRHNNYKKTNVLFYDGHAITALRVEVLASRTNDVDNTGRIVFKAVRK